MKKIYFLMCIALLFLLLPCVVSAFTVTGVTVNPTGYLTSGTSVSVMYRVDCSGFPSGDELRMSTDLDNPQWAPTLIVNGVENVRPVQTGSISSITGFELSYKSGDEVSVRIVLTGNVPVNPSPSQNLMLIQELDYSGNVISSSVYTLSMPVTPTPTPTPTYGSIGVSSTPSSANIYLDNEYKGLTTLNMNNVANGNHIVLVRLTGYQDWTQTVAVLGNSTSLSATLVAITNTTTTTTTVTPTPAINSTTNGTIDVKSSPTSSKVFLSSNYWGDTPLTLDNITPGTYTVQVQRAGYNIYSESVKVTAGNTSYVTASLVLSPEVTTVTTTVPTTTITTVRTTAKSTAKIPTPWPSDTPTPASPVSILAILGAVGVGFVVLRKY